ncbi:MAG: hypothetical protein QM742_18990, partial [Aquabacterium sp.]
AELQGFQLQAHFEASAALSSSLRWLSPRLAAVAPASLSSSADPSLTLIGLDMPLQRIDLLWDDATASGRITHARFSGGVVIEADRPGTAERVGRMTLSHFDVDLEQGMVRVDIEGAQGVGFMPQVQMWSFDHVESTALIGDASCGGHAAMAACSPVSWQGLTLPGLTITTLAFDVMARSLAVVAYEKTRLAAVQDSGTIRISTVPEAGTGAAMSLGLISLAWMRRRQRQAGTA